MREIGIVLLVAGSVVGCSGDGQDGAGLGSGGVTSGGFGPNGSGGVVGGGGVSPSNGTGGGNPQMQGGNGGATTAGAAGGAIASTGGVTSTGGVPVSNGGSASGGTTSAVGGASGASGGANGGTTTGAGGMQANLPSGIAYMFPPPGGQGVCPDAPLRIRFAGGAPGLGSSGKVAVHDDAGNVVASIDLSAATTTDTIGGTTLTVPRRAFVDGNDAVFGLKVGALAYGKTYYITVDAAAVRAPGGVGFVVADSSTWRFSTKASGPGDVASLAVALDGTGDLCSVQGALDAVPANNTKARTITVAAGTYHEIVHVRGKNNVTLHGADRKQTIIAGTNNNNLNPSTSTRSLVGVDAATGVVFENLTIHNLTPQNGSQAEALRLQGCDQCVVRDADIVSLQDTLLWSGRIYAKNCYIEGNVDYVWGTGVVYFDGCEIRTVGRTGVLVQSRNAPGAYGYVFVNSKLTADASATNNILARIDASAYPGSHVAYVDCEMQSIAPAGWTITGAAPTSELRFWESGSHDSAGNAIDVSRRVAGLTPITAAQVATMRDASAVLGGWKPPP